MLTFIANLCVQIPPEDVNHASALHRCCRKIRACRWCRTGTWGRWWRRTSISRCPAWCLQSSGSKRMGRMISSDNRCSAVDCLRPSPPAAHYTVLSSRRMQRAITRGQALEVEFIMCILFWRVQNLLFGLKLVCTLAYNTKKLR